MTRVSCCHPHPPNSKTDIDKLKSKMILLPSTPSKTMFINFEIIGLSKNLYPSSYKHDAPTDLFDLF